MSGKIRVDFINLESTLVRDSNIILDALNEIYPGRIELAKNALDIVFVGEDKSQSLDQYRKCRKVYIAQENKMPNFRFFDYALSYLDLKDPRNLRLPFYVYQATPDELVVDSTPAEDVLKTKTKFCAFVVSNQNTKRGSKRVDFFHKLSRYKKVDSGGRVLNNIGYNVQDKIAFLRDYKFVIAFENRSYRGYTSEKIVHGMKARCMPIYWGNPGIEEDFNPRSFVNVHDFSSLDEAVDYVVSLDQDDGLYLKALREPYFSDNKPNIFYNTGRLGAFLKEIVENPERRTSGLYIKDWVFNLRKTIEPYFSK